MTGGYSIVRELFCPRAGGTYFCPRCAGTQHLSEAADVFAWLMNIQNNIDLRDGKREEQYGLSLEGNFCRAYPDICLECKKQRCICPPILKSTIGRMGHELPLERGLFDLSKIFLAPHMAKTVFRPPT
jgi:hypothetical protein